MTHAPLLFVPHTLEQFSPECALGDGSFPGAASGARGGQTSGSTASLFNRTALNLCFSTLGLHVKFRLQKQFICQKS